MTVRLALAVAALLSAGSAAAQQIVYEREYEMIAGGDNVLRIVVEADGSVQVDRPAFMTHSGRHQGRIPDAAWRGLLTAMRAIDFGGRALAADIRRRSANEVFHVSDAEISRFALYDADGQPLRFIEAKSISAYAERFDDARLKRLRRLEQRLLDVMTGVVGAGRGRP
ncbi:MAG: hypothetical protein RQ847_10265 [Wenzhouxiangellaceae bacterium]|nr:hypothetical protein [Wenzhouxiangellaceae bacterium]